jgi:molybdenum cofactor synthesis domain-containing protein
MLTPSEALAEILARIPGPDPAGAETVPLAWAAGRRLARPVVSDVNLPPFEKAMMDGYAFPASATGTPPSRHRVVGEARAGRPHGGRVEPGQCVTIATGAELPAGCDAVEMIERTARDGDHLVLEHEVPPGRHVAHRGEVLALGGTVYEPRRRLSPADLSVLASVGCDPVPVFPVLRVSVLTTGDELVPPAVVPGAGQIREGNTFYLRAACLGMGCEVVRSGIVPDDAAALEAAFGEALEDSDVVLTTGGVSVGKYDLVGQTFERLGVEPILHKVAVKPGKPIWFGMRGSRPVFGLPGNPVSTLLGFEVFVRAALARLAGDEAGEERERLARGTWQGGDVRAGDRQENLPARARPTASGVVELEPLPWRGSADIVTAARADALVVIPPGAALARGAGVDYRPLRGW